MNRKFKLAFSGRRYMASAPRVSSVAELSEGAGGVGDRDQEVVELKSKVLFGMNETKARKSRSKSLILDFLQYTQLPRSKSLRPRRAMPKIKFEPPPINDATTDQYL